MPTTLAGAGPIDLGGAFVEELDKLGRRPVLHVVLGIDEGYDGDQLLDGILGGNLTEDGTIVDDGEPVAPTNPPAGVVSRDGTDGEATFAEINKAAKEAATDLVADADLDLKKKRVTVFFATLIVMARVAGYDPEQIILDGILGDDPAGFQVIGREGAFIFRGIYDAEGNRIAPGLNACTTCIEDEEAFLNGAIGRLERTAGGGDVGEDVPTPPKAPKGGYAVSFEGDIDRSTSASSYTIDVRGSGTMRPRGTTDFAEITAHVSISATGPEGTCSEEGDVPFVFTVTKRGGRLDIDVHPDNLRSVIPAGGLDAEGCLNDVAAATLSLEFGFPTVTLPAKGGAATVSGSSGATITLTLTR
jgi:hypothetical protein